VLLHDYHFYLVAARVRERCPSVVLSHFVHIPWPGPDAWRVLPPSMRERLMYGLLGNDVVAFHTEIDILLTPEPCSPRASIQASREHPWSLVGTRSPPQKRLKGGWLRCDKNLMFTVG